MISSVETQPITKVDDAQDKEAKRAAALKEANNLVRESSSKLSERVRSFNLGVLAVNWAALVGDKSIGHPITPGVRRQLLAISALAVLGFGVDCLQYFASYALHARLAHDIDKKRMNEVAFDDQSLAYVLPTFAFKAKLCIGLLTFSWFVGLFAFILIWP